MSTDGPSAHLDANTAADLLRGHLSPGQAAAWQAHLRQCVACRAIVAEERALHGMLALGDIAPRAAGTSVTRGDFSITLDRASHSRPWYIALGFGVAANLLMTLSWMCYPPPVTVAGSVERELAAELGVPPEVQEQVVRSLAQLRVLTADSWVADDLETARALAKLIREFPH
ncbi:MAG: hypothetical protein IPM18_17460 [Phycisphaerales bacterium]|nr:hypothetical protein [Phycisphaerales bacterium]